MIRLSTRGSDQGIRGSSGLASLTLQMHHRLKRRLDLLVAHASADSEYESWGNFQSTSSDDSPRFHSVSL